MSTSLMADLRAGAASPVRIVAAIALGGLVLVGSVLAPGGRCVAKVEPSVSCADVNGDDLLNVADPATLLRFLFLGGPPPTCSGAVGICGDVNADAEVDFDDILCLLGWLFLGDREIVCAGGCANAEAPEIEGFAFVGCNAEGYPEYTHDATGIVSHVR